MNKAQEKLREKHGTPEEFERAIWNGYADMFVTMGEALAAITKYNNEWNEAGEERNGHSNKG